VTEHHQAKRQPLEEVKDQVKARVIAAQAAERARTEGEKLLAALKADGEPALDKFAPATTVTRASPGELSAQALTQTFKLPDTSLPAYTGVDLGPRGYQLVRLEKTEAPDAGAEDRRQTYLEQARQVLAQTAISAYVNEVKSRTSIERNLKQ
jgi:peptidyl-prolyl cis-trans isomerase D